MKQKTKLEIIDETVAYYSEDVSRRSIKRSEEGVLLACLYVDDKGNNCAFSRCCTDGGKEILHRAYESKGIISQMLHYLREEYKGHSTQFWSNVQDIHDVDVHWDNTGITKCGLEYVNLLKDRYKE